MSGLAILAVLILAACRKDSGGTRIPAAGVMAFNLAPDRDAVGISLNGNQLTPQPMGFTNYNGMYQQAYTGTREVRSYDVQHDTTLAVSSVDLEDQELYSVFLIGNAGVYRHLIVHDDLDSSAPATQAYIRFVQAIPDSSDLNITVGGEMLEQPVRFGDCTPFEGVSGGEVQVSVSNGSGISAERTLTLESGRVYTILLVGLPDAEQEEKSVQIRYIQNGAVEASGVE